MEARKKRALLARIEGQLAAMDRGDQHIDRRWRRIAWALGALGELSLDEGEQMFLGQLQHHVDRMQRDAEAGVAPELLRHRRTLVRTDCVLWQLQLRRRQSTEGSRAA